MRTKNRACKKNRKQISYCLLFYFTQGYLFERTIISTVPGKVGGSPARDGTPSHPRCFDQKGMIQLGDEVMNDRTSGGLRGRLVLFVFVKACCLVMDLLRWPSTDSQKDRHRKNPVTASHRLFIWPSAPSPANERLACHI